VVGIFPHPDALTHLVGAVLNDTHDECQAGDRRYLSESSTAVLYPDTDNGAIAAVNSGEQAPRISSKPTITPDSGVCCTNR
jgi:putative transposase